MHTCGVAIAALSTSLSGVAPFRTIGAGRCRCGVLLCRSRGRTSGIRRTRGIRRQVGIVIIICTRLSAMA